MKDKRVIPDKMKQIMIPVSKPEEQYQCGTWSTVFPPISNKIVKKEEKSNEITDTITT